jgi:hypothetical protein
MNGRCSQISHINNVNHLTWLHKIRDLPCPLVSKNVVIKRYYIHNDESVLQKVRVLQQSFELTLPTHLTFAQQLFGTAAGIGTRIFLSCRLKRRQLLAFSEDRHQIQYGDELNIVLFENSSYELIRRGIILQYIPSEQELNVIIRFRKMKGHSHLEHQFLARNMLNANQNGFPEDNEAYPFHNSIGVFGSFIYKVCLNTKTVVLKMRL